MAIGEGNKAAIAQAKSAAKHAVAAMHGIVATIGPPQVTGSSKAIVSPNARPSEETSSQHLVQLLSLAAAAGDEVAARSKSRKEPPRRHMGRGVVSALRLWSSSVARCCE